MDTDSLDKHVYPGRPAPFAKYKAVIFPYALTEIVPTISGI